MNRFLAGALSAATLALAIPSAAPALEPGHDDTVYPSAAAWANDVDSTPVVTADATYPAPRAAIRKAEPGRTPVAAVAMDDATYAPEARPAAPAREDRRRADREQLACGCAPMR